MENLLGEKDEAVESGEGWDKLVAQICAQQIKHQNSPSQQFPNAWFFPVYIVRTWHA